VEPSGDALLDQLKATAERREASRVRRLQVRWALAAIAAALAVAIPVAVVQLGRPKPHHLVLPSRIESLPQLHTAALDARIRSAIDSARSGEQQGGVRIPDVRGAFYGTDPSSPDVMLLLLQSIHPESSSKDLLTLFESPFILNGNVSLDGDHTVSDTAHGVSFTCEPATENGTGDDAGKTIYRTTCVWDDHQDVLGLMLDLKSTDAAVLLRAVESVQPSTEPAS
jgi:hypothetical protein